MQVIGRQAYWEQGGRGGDQGGKDREQEAWKGDREARVGIRDRSGVSNGTIRLGREGGMKPTERGRERS